MAKKPGNGAAASKKGHGSGGKLAGRIVLYGLLAVLLVLGLLEFRTKSAAQATGDAWIEAFNSVTDDQEFSQSQLAAHIKGSPVPEVRDSKFLEGRPVDSVVTYTWSGVFRHYKVYVGLGLEEDPSVVHVIGPGAEDPFAAE